MPWKSKSQRRLCYALQKKNPASTWDCKAIDRETPDLAKLPERARSEDQIMRCGRPTKSGGACRNVVRRKGAACAKHRVSGDPNDVIARCRGTNKNRTQCKNRCYGGICARHRGGPAAAAAAAAAPLKMEKRVRVPKPPHMTHKVPSGQKPSGDCVRQTTKKYTSRPSPPYPANKCPAGDRRKGNNGEMFVAKPNRNGVNRWVRDKSESTRTDRKAGAKKSDKKTSKQCTGQTKAGSRCKRMCRSGTMCAQHSK